MTSICLSHKFYRIVKYCHLPHVINIIITEIPITIKVIHPIVFDNFPFVSVLRKSLSFDIFNTAKRIGIEVMAFITAAYTNALIGSIFTKLISKPIDSGGYNYVKCFGLFKFFVQALFPAKSICQYIT